MGQERIHLKTIQKTAVFAFLLVSFIAAACVAAGACPALEIPRQYSQPSGETFTATLHGDEWFNYTAAQTGELIVKGNDGYWYYALASGKGFEKSGAKFKIDAKPGLAQTEKDVKKLKDAKLSVFEKTYDTPVPNRTAGSASATAVTGTQKLLVLLVSFTDKTIVNTDSAWSGVFFGDTGKTLKTYYKENSQNNFYFAPAAETKGTANDGVIRVTLSYAHPNTGEDTDSRNKDIVINAINAANAYINFRAFDTNSDGIVTATELHILTVVAGNDCSAGDPSPSIWPHSWTTDDYIYKDSVNIYGDYTQIAETQEGHMTTMGVVAHELGHDLGLPDLYDTDYSSDGLGVYSLMASGSWGKASGEYAGTSPTHLDAWSKIQLGFAAPVTAGTGSYAVNAVANGYNILKIATSDPNQYFLVENRQCASFDAGMYYYGITTGGIAVYHIDMSVTTDNDNETRKLVDLEEANQVAYGGCQLDDDNAKNYAYNNLFRSGINTLFSFNSTPASSLYSGASTDISVGVPGSSSGTMTVDISLVRTRTVTFQSNGGTAVAALTRLIGSSVSKPTDPAKTGHTFAGWYADAGLTSAATWPFTLGAANITFYAKWNANIYTITYDGNGSTGGSTANSAHTYGLPAALSLNGFTRTGYNFTGWSAEQTAAAPAYTDGQTVVNITPNPNEFFTFYAVWEKVPVTLAALGGSTTVINTAAGAIYGLSPGITKAQFESGFIEISGNARLEYTTAGNYLGTGTGIELIDNETDETSAAYAIVIFGDTNGDSVIGALDADTCVLVQDWMIDWNPNTDAAFCAAGDINGDGRVDSIDADLITAHSNWVVEIDQTTGLAG